MDNKEYNGTLRYFTMEVPEVIEHVAGIRVFGRRLKSFIFTTDIALIKNNNADAVMAVYPFTSMHAINEPIIRAAETPVFCGIGGLNADTDILVDIAKMAQFSGAMGVVAHAHVNGETIARLKKSLDIPLVVTVASLKENIERKIDSGADMLNVSGAADTCGIVEKIREKFPYIPVIATGGPTDRTILDTIESGADAISYSPPGNAEIFKMQMKLFRENLPRKK